MTEKEEQELVEIMARAIWETKPGARKHPWNLLGMIRNDFHAEARAALQAAKAAGFALVRATRA